MSDITLFQWPAGRGVESIFPRSVVFKRICNLAQIDAKIFSVTVPEPGEDFLPKLRQRLSHIPLMECNGIRFTNSREIIDFLLSITTGDANDNLRRLDWSHSFVTQEWANLVFINSLVYARWAREENFRRFISGVQWGQVQGLEQSLNLLRSEVLKYLDRTLFRFDNDGVFHEHLREQLVSLDVMLIGQEFFEPLSKAPSLTDLYVFMVMQGLLSPDLEESQWIRPNYANLMRWYDRVDELTRN